MIFLTSNYNKATKMIPILNLQQNNRQYKNNLTDIYIIEPTVHKNSFVLE